MNARILVVDDEQSLLDFLRLLLGEAGYEVQTADSMADGRREVAENPYDLVLCDILMPDGNGLDLLREIKRINPRCHVILMSAYGSVETAVGAMKAGAFDFITKPFRMTQLVVRLENACSIRTLREQNVHLQEQLERRHSFSKIIGKSKKMQEVFELIRRAAPARTPWASSRTASPAGACCA